MIDVFQIDFAQFDAFYIGNNNNNDFYEHQ